MAAEVPQQRSTPYYAEVQISVAARQRLWRDLGNLYHWLRGHGRQIIPAHSPRVKVGQSPAPSSRTLRYRLHPSATAIARVWQVVVRSDSRADLGDVLVTYPDSVALQYTAGDTETVNAEGIAAHYYLEPLAAKSPALAELALSCEHVSGGDVWIESVSCYELPRAQLTQDATDLGVDVETLRSGQPIYDGSNASFTALAEGLCDDDTPPRRVLHAHAFDTVSIGAGPTALYTLPVPLVPRKIGRTDTTAPVWVAVYAYASDGTTEGTITFEAASGDTVVLSVTSDTPGWIETTDAASQLTVECEDLSTDDGAPNTGIDTVQVTIERTAGSGSIMIESVCVWEGPEP